jgi:hypothetical protein
MLNDRNQQKNSKRAAKNGNEMTGNGNNGQNKQDRHLPATALRNTAGGKSV